jgi:hypothetical protein
VNGQNQSWYLLMESSALNPQAQLPRVIHHPPHQLLEAPQLAVAAVAAAVPVFVLFHPHAAAEEGGGAADAFSLGHSPVLICFCFLLAEEVESQGVGGAGRAQADELVSPLSLNLLVRQFQL